MKSKKRIAIYGLVTVTIILTAGIGLAMLKNTHINRSYYGEIIVSTDKDIYKIGENINISSVVFNNAEFDLKLKSASFSLYIVSPLGDVLSMACMKSHLEHIVVTSKSELQFCNYSWDQKNMENNQVTTGEYTIIVEFIDNGYSGETTIFIEN